MYFYCAKSDNLLLLKNLLNHNSAKGKYITYGAAFNGFSNLYRKCMICAAYH